MMQRAVIVEFRGPTDTQGSRWLVRVPAAGMSEPRRKVIPRDHALDSEEDILRAVKLALRDIWGVHYVPRGDIYIIPHGPYSEGAFVVPFRREG